MRIAESVLKAVTVVGVVVGIVAIVLLYVSLSGVSPAPREAPVPLHSVIAD